MSKTYPYVAVRYIPAVYGHFSVRFVDPYENHADTEKFVIACALPFFDEKLTLEARESLVKAALAESIKSKFRLCVVFGESDCVYCEPTGEIKESNLSPKGGIQALQFPLQSTDGETRESV